MRTLRTGLREAEDVVHEHQHVGVVGVAEIFSDCEAGQRHTETRSRRLVHLTVDECDLVENVRLLEFQVEVIPFTGAFADAAEHRLAAVCLGDVVDQLLNDDRLAHTSAAEQADLATLHERGDEVDDLDARLEDFGLRFEVHEVGTLAMDRPARCIGRNGGTVVDRVTEHIENATECCGTDGHHDRAAGVHHFHPAHHGVGTAHRNGAHLIAADVLLHFERDLDVRAVWQRLVDAERVVQLGKVIRFEFDVEHRADDLHHLAGHRRGSCCCCHMKIRLGVSGRGTDYQPWSAAAPPTISAISCVICA